MNEFEFEFEIEFGQMTEDQDRIDAALLARFPVFRPIDLAIFGGWEDETQMLMLALGDGGWEERS
jgi:hypothetical protein